MDIIALVFLIAGKVANIKGLMTTAIVISSVCIVLNLIISAATKDVSAATKDDDERSFKAMLGVVIDAIILTLSIIFRAGM